MPENHSTEKRCGKCREVKPLEAFGMLRGKPRSYCRICHRLSSDKLDSRTEKRCPRCLKVKAIDEYGMCGKGRQSYCKECSRTASRGRHFRNKEAGLSVVISRNDYISRRKWVKILSKYGMTRDQYEAMEKEQNFLCAICNRPEKAVYKGTPLRLTVDHDHTTGKIRGLLCRGCNLAIGKLQEDPDIAQRAADYLRTHKESLTLGDNKR